MRRLPTALLLACLAASARAEPPPTAARLADPAKPPWQHWQVQRGALPPVDVYLARDDTPRPLIVFAAGSHCVPLFFYTMKGSEKRFRSTLLFQDLLEQKDRGFHFAAVERRGLASFQLLDDLHDDCTDAHGSVTKEDRVRDTADAARALAGQPWVSELVVAGHSEGADVASGVSRQLGGAVHAVGLFAGGGPSQLFDHVVEARRAGSDAEVQSVFDELLSLTGPRPPERYRGFPVERYRSYALRSTALDDLAGGELPVFIAQGTRDKNSPVESADLVAVELLRRSPERKVRYLILPGLDHSFSTADGTDHQSEVLRAFIDWSAHPTRGVETRGGSAGGGVTQVRYFGVDVKAWRIVGPGVALLLVLVLLVLRRRRRSARPL